MLTASCGLHANIQQTWEIHFNNETTKIRPCVHKKHDPTSSSPTHASVHVCLLISKTTEISKGVCAQWSSLQRLSLRSHNTVITNNTYTHSIAYPNRDYFTIINSGASYTIEGLALQPRKEPHNGRRIILIYDMYNKRYIKWNIDHMNFLAQQCCCKFWFNQQVPARVCCLMFKPHSWVLKLLGEVVVHHRIKAWHNGIIRLPRRCVVKKWHVTCQKTFKKLDLCFSSTCTKQTMAYCWSKHTLKVSMIRCAPHVI